MGMRRVCHFWRASSAPTKEKTVVEAQLVQQFGISFIDISSYFGLAAAGIMTLNLLLGLLLSVQYNPVDAWPHRRLPIFAIHKWSGYGSLFVVLLHPVWLPFARGANFTWLAVFYPLAAPMQPVINALGGLAAYTLVFVVVTAWLRNKFKYGTWKKLHYASYVVIVAFLVHGVWTNPSLEPGTSVDFLDGGKIFVEVCAVLALLMLGWRFNVGQRLRGVNLRKALAIAQSARPAWKGNLVVANITEFPGEVRVFRLVDSAGGPLPFAFRAGQYLSIRINADDRTVVRNYSICSAPEQKEFCEIAVKRIDGGAGSTVLHTRLATGQKLDCAGPRGTFTFSGDESDSLVMIAGGIGITPLLSILKYLAARQWPHDVFLIFAVRTPAHVLFEEELRTLQSEYQHLKLLVLPTSIVGHAWNGPHGVISGSVLAAFIPHLKIRRIHLCGPLPMMTAVGLLLKEVGVRDAQIYTESFGSQGDVQLDDDLVDAGITFQRSSVTCSAPAGMTLLDAADMAGVVLESSCRTGTCGTCKVRLLEGKVKMHRDDSLTGKELRGQVVLACQARAVTGQVTLDV